MKGCNLSDIIAIWPTVQLNPVFSPLKFEILFPRKGTKLNCEEVVWYFASFPGGPLFPLTPAKLNVEIVTLVKKNYNLRNILKKLASMGVCNLLVEGGAKIFTLFLKEKKFDDILIFRSNFFIGGKGFNATEFELEDLSKIKLFKKDVKKIGNDTLEILTRK